MRASQYEPFIDDKKEWISDKYFTQQRLAGVNPMSLRRVTFHAVSEGQWFPLPLCLYCSRKRELRNTKFKEQGMELLSNLVLQENFE